MAETKKYDIVIFGASGFTGQYLVEEMCKESMENSNKLSWAIAGRNMKKLEKVLEEASKNTGYDTSEIPIIMSQLESLSSLTDMTHQARVLINLVGPYIKYGTSVVQACISTKTHHVDISGEVVWLESIFLDYDKAAKEANVYIVQSCGFDSIPHEMGINFTRKNLNGSLNSVESFVKFHPGPKGYVVHDGTLKSAVESFRNNYKLKEIRKQIYKETVPNHPGNPLKKRGWLFYEKMMGGYCIPFPGTDRAIIKRTNYQNHIKFQHNPVGFEAYTVMDSVFSLFGYLFLAFFFLVLHKFSIGRSILYKFPRFFSLGFFSSQGPTREQVNGMSFEMTLFGDGEKRGITKIKGPDPGYRATSICALQSALVILSESQKLPKEYGVYTPGFLFDKSSLVEKLESRGITFRFQDPVHKIQEGGDKQN